MDEHRIVPDAHQPSKDASENAQERMEGGPTPEGRKAPAHSRPPEPDLEMLENGAGNGIRTRDFDLGKVALYH
jgi:hypothetical protein